MFPKFLTSFKKLGQNALKLELHVKFIFYFPDIRHS